jgi:AhpD family alkylhydroperoxidase
MGHSRAAVHPNSQEEIMQPRFNGAKHSLQGIKGLQAVEKYLHDSGLEVPLLHLVKLRASQINGCAYCLDMHWKDLKAIGQEDKRLYSLDAWEECPYYSERERAALAWTEAVTRIADGHAADSVYEEVKGHFTEKELSDLTLAIAMINTWNRISIASRTEPGTYHPQQAPIKAAS